MGNSLKSSSIVEGIAVHPHVHGELITDYEFVEGCIGSSPRAWGTLPGYTV